MTNSTLEKTVTVIAISVIFVGLIALAISLGLFADSTSDARLEPQSAGVVDLPPFIMKTEPLDVERFISALTEVEGWKGRPGPAGEQGILQWREFAWKEVSDRDFSWAAMQTPMSLKEQHAAAIRTVALARDRMAASLVEETPRNIALVIMAGFDSFQRRKYTTVKADAAQRVANIYEAAK